MSCRSFLAASVIAVAAVAMPFLGALPASAHTVISHHTHVPHLKHYALHANSQDMQGTQEQNDQSHAAASAPADPPISVNPGVVAATGNGNVAFTVSGTGFVPNSKVDVFVTGAGPAPFYAIVAFNVHVDFRGDFLIGLNGSGVAAGTYPVVAQDETVMSQTGTSFVTVV